MKPPRYELGEAAVRVLAEAGSRGFTHRAVDRLASVPEGTTSRYARTRAALLALACDALLAQDRREALGALLGEGAPITSRASVVDLLTRVSDALLQAPERFRARVELQLEGARAPALRVYFEEARAAFTAPLAQVLSAAGYPESEAVADRMITLVDAILYRQIIAGQAPLSPETLTAIFTVALGLPDTVVGGQSAPR